MPRRVADALALRLLGTITGVRTDEPAVALTFDDGPHPDSTGLLLDILDRHDARATFFMVGEAAARYPDLVKRAAAAGHAVGNHSWDHPSFRLITARERRRQMRACQAALSPSLSPMFRPPYGHQSIASRLDAVWMGYRVVTWTVQAIDWLDHDPDRLLAPLLPRIAPGHIILFHDAIFRPPADPR
jgi:peptidoglycan/xylan/chitin deacetylase (PgdA/CDA1 family)